MTKFLFFSALYLLTFTSFGQSKSENLKIVWAEEYKWKLASNQEDDRVHFLEIVPGNEDVNNWTMLGTMMSLKNTKVENTDQVVQLYKESSLKESPKAKLTVLEKDDTAKNIWVLFKIETPSFPNDPKPESQLYYAIQSEATLYVSFIAVKQKKLSDDFIDKWTKVFKSSEFVYE